MCPFLCKNINEITNNHSISAKFVYKGDLNIFVRTASKYDDVQLLKLPNLKLILGIHWVCLGNPNDHHSVVQCAPDKVPEYSSNQVNIEDKMYILSQMLFNFILKSNAMKNLLLGCRPIAIA